MVEKPEREKVPSGRRAPDGREWEVFVRDEASSPLRHVGSVRAVDPDDAHRSASRLFGWFARDVWVVPADEVHRYVSDSISDDTTATSPDEGGEERTVEF